jgi:hypothetical protein
VPAEPGAGGEVLLVELALTEAGIAILPER